MKDSIYKPGDIITYKGTKYKVIALAGLGDKVVYGWPVGAEPPKGTDRVRIKVSEINQKQ